MTTVTSRDELLMKGPERYERQSNSLIFDLS
jgi:hypothetical protein